MSKTTTRISGKLPAATLAQRIAAMSTGELMAAARELARRTDAASDTACTAVLEELEGRTDGPDGPGFLTFLSEIYA